MSKEFIRLIKNNRVCTPASWYLYKYWLEERSISYDKIYWPEDDAVYGSPPYSIVMDSSDAIAFKLKFNL